MERDMEMTAGGFVPFSGGDDPLAAAGDGSISIKEATMEGGLVAFSDDGDVMDGGDEGLMAEPENSDGERLTLVDMEESAAWRRDPWAPEAGAFSLHGGEWETRLAQARIHDREQRAADLAALRAVWLYEDDEEARKLVDGHGKFSVYQAPTMRLDDALPCYGRDYAAAADPDFADEPMGLCERAMELVQDEGRRKAYREEFAALARERRDARAYYGLYGKMVRDEVRGEYARRLEGVEEFKRGLKEYGEQLAVELPRVALSGGDLDAELMEKATRYGDAGRVVASLGRTRAALEELRTLQRGGRSVGAYEADVRRRADQLRREWFDSLHGRGTEVPADEVFIQQAKADEGGSYAVDRGAIGRVVSLLRDGDGKLDEGALALMVLALDADAQGQQSIDSKFLRNFGEALQSWLVETADFVNRGNARSGFIYQGPDMPAVYLSKAEQAEFRDAYSADAERLKGALRMLEDKRLSASEKAGLLEGVLTELGTMAGDSAAGIAVGSVFGGPLGGWLGNTAALAPAAMNRDVAQAFYEGKSNAELDGMISGFFQAASEAGFGTALRTVPLMGRVLDRLALTGMGSKAVAQAVAKLQGNVLARFALGRVGGESLGEVLGEEVVSQSWTCLTVAGLRRLGVDLDEAEWHPFATAWENITDYRQSMATVAFCTSLGLLGLRADRHAAAQFARRTDAMVAAGVTPQSAAKIAQLGEKTEAEIAELYRKEGAGRRTDERAQALWDEKFTADVDDIYRREVAEEDPQVLRDRLEKERNTYLSRVEAEVSLREGVLQAALREAGLLESEQTMDGRYRLTVADKARVWEDSKGWKDGRRPEGYVEPVKVVEMTEAQLAAWAQLEMGEASLRRMKEIRSAALALDMAGRVDEGGYAKMLPLTAAAAPVARELAAAHGSINLPVLRALAEAARREGSEGAQVLPGVRNEVTAGLEHAFGQRLDVAVRMGEVSAAEAAHVGAAAVRLPAVDGSSSRSQDAAWVRLTAETPTRLPENAALPPASRIVYNPGHTKARSVAEDAVESMLAARLRRDGGVDAEGRVTPKGRVWLEGLLGEMRRVNESVKASTGRELMPGLDGAKADLQTAAEYFSHLAQSDFYLRAGDYGLSEEARRHVEFMDSALMQGRMLEMFDKGFSQWVRTKEGRAWEKSGGTLAGLLREAGHELGSLYNRSRVTAENVAAVEAARAYMREPGKVSLAELEETLAQAAQEQEVRDAAPAVSRAVPAEESVTGEVIPDDGGEAEALYTADGELVAPLGAEVQGGVADGREAARGAGLVGGRFAPLADGSVMGVARVEDVGLCPDVPQFKTKAGAAGRERANEDGTTHELNGGFRKDAPPITVWRRRDGALQVITGRHRLAHARKCGEEFISVRVYDEDAAHDAAWAKLYDVEMNILDRQASAVDVAYFFRNTQMTEAEAEARGLIARRKDGGQTATGTVGMAVARHACDAVYTNFINGLINDRQAYFIATLGVDESGQQLALKLLMDDKKGRSLEYVKAYVTAAQKQQAASDAPQEFNLFGEDESWAREADKLARYVDGLRRQLRAQMGIMQGAGRLEKKGAAAEKLGIRVETPADLQAALARLALLDSALERMDADLHLGGQAAAWDGKSTPRLSDARLMDYSAKLAVSASLDAGSMSLETPLSMSAALLKNEKGGVDADGELHTHGLEGLGKEEAKARVFGQAKENIEPLRRIVNAAAAAVDGRAMMRPANKENGLETKAPSTAFAKAERDYNGDISRVVDLIGGTCVLKETASYADAVEAIRAALPEGCSIAKVKKLGFGGSAPCYQDVKVSIRFVNGGIGEVILVSEHMNDAKFNRGGHAVYELYRILKPLSGSFGDVEIATADLEKLSSAIYSADLDSETFNRAKASASWALQHLNPALLKSRLSSNDMMVVKSSSSLLKAAIPLSVSSAAIPSFSEIKKGIPSNNVQETDGDVNHEFESTYSLELGRAAEAAVQPYGKEAMMEQMVRSIRSAARVWRTTFAGRDPQEARDKAAEQMGRLMAMATGIYRVLPQGYRAGLDKLLRRGRVLAQMVESGRVLNYGRMSAKEMDALREELEDARSEFNALETVAGGYRVDGMSKAEAYREANAQLARELGGKKLTELQAEIAEAAAGQLARYLRDREVGRIARLVEMYTPRKGKDGKLKRGKMGAEAYRELQELVRMMNAMEDVRAEEIAALQGRIAEAERVGNAGLADELTAKQMAWSAFGAIAQQGLENVRKAHAQLRVLLGEGRARWEAKLEDEKARLEYEADEAVAGMGEADDTNLAKAREKERRASLWQRLKALPAYAQSIGQLFYGLGSTPGLGRLADETSRAITRGHLALATRENELQAAMAAKLEELGFKTAAQKADFVQRLRKVEDTGVVPEGEMVRRRVKMSVEDARRWVGMDKEGRDEVRKDIKKEEKRSRRKAANVPQEEDISLMREELEKIDAGRRERKWVTVERDVRMEGKKRALRMNRDQALNLLLLCEQERYVRNADRHGYTGEVRERLREFVGEDVLEFGYWMRDWLSRSGLAEVFEAREGVPFPAEENYWPGVSFDQSGRVNENVSALDPGSGQCSTRYSMLVLRVNHDLHFDTSVGATNAFMGAVAMTNNYICMGEITAKWRRLLSNRRFARALRQRVGESSFRAIKDGLNVLDGQGVAEAYAQRAVSGIVGMFQGAHAPAVLAGSMTTLVKQFSALMHGSGCEGVNAVGLMRQLLLDRVPGAGGPMTYRKMMREAVFAERHGRTQAWEDMMRLGENVTWSRLAAWSRVGMDALERMDVAANCVGMTALYNILYTRMEKRNKEGGGALGEREMHERCMAEVERMMDLGAQPMRASQKSLAQAMGGGVWGRLSFYMGSESMNKLGMFLASGRRHGYLKAWLKYLIAMSCAEQLMCMMIDLMRGNLPEGEDESWAMWLACHVGTGISGAGLLSGVPIVGALVNHATGGYVKTASVADALGLDVWRNGKKIWKMSTGRREYSGAEWLLQLLNASRALTGALGVAGGGVYSGIQWVSGATGLLQSVNAAGNVVRPFVPWFR